MMNNKVPIRNVLIVSKDFKIHQMNSLYQLVGDKQVMLRLTKSLRNSTPIKFRRVQMSVQNKL